jgi:hypothetical protein
VLQSLPLAFGAPAVLAALAALPLLYLLLRVTPPSPRRVDFPPLRILLDLIPTKETVARTPWWLLLLRLLTAAIVIVALASPIWNPRRDIGSGGGPLLLIVDNGWPSAADWSDRVVLAEQYVLRAQREGRGVALVATAERPVAPALEEAGQALERLRGLKPQPHRPDRAGHSAPVSTFLGTQPAASVVWIADGVTSDAGDAMTTALAGVGAGRSIVQHRQPQPGQLAIAATENLPSGLVATVIRAAANGRDGGLLRALDRRGSVVGEVRFGFAAGATETTAAFNLPLELRNDVARIEIAEERSAGAVQLIDSGAKRRRVGIVAGTSADTAQPLLAPYFYLSRALSPFADIREGRGGPAEAITALIDEKPSVLVLADIGAIPPNVYERVVQFVDNGGVLIRFAGNRLAAANDDLVPVRLRRGGRNLGGALSWQTPKALMPFADDSPFRNLKPPAEVTVSRQILAEPGPQLATRSWAALSDGTPVVTGVRRGKGLIAMFHVTADTSWSNLPLSGLFIDMLRVIVAMAADTSQAAAAPAAAGTAPAAQAATLAPTRTLDGYGFAGSPPPTARPIPSDYRKAASFDHPPGYYGPTEANVAVNALVSGERLLPLPNPPTGISVAGLQAAKPIDLRPLLWTLALMLFLIDTIATLILGGALARFRRPRLPAAAGLALFFVVAGLTPGSVEAQTSPVPGQPATTKPAAPPGKREMEGASVTRLAYVVTGNRQVDEASLAGLRGLSLAIAQRTALEPGDPVGVDPARDELAVYPILYWPMVANAPAAPDDAIRRLDAFMKNGGTVIFDTRDGLNVRVDSASGETSALRRLLRGLDIPALEPVPKDHVVTKAFYLLDRFVGRYDTAETWIEALPPADPGGGPARAGDNVSPIIITGNDLAAAWATNSRGEPLYPLVGSDPRQREMAIRGGVNIVLYALTGNYKADQVHVPALLERLGQ